MGYSPGDGKELDTTEVTERARTQVAKGMHSWVAQVLPSHHRMNSYRKLPGHSDEQFFHQGPCSVYISSYQTFKRR